jgi:hypothetical protein
MMNDCSGATWWWLWELISSSRRNIYNHTHGTWCSKQEGEAKIVSQSSVDNKNELTKKILMHTFLVLER